ncbi:hypothetical protein V5O48_016771 [Marasmius crinis-equi]|uniref:Uncharacterized protein n=1 Tax=Marasmius crinis-equi TaxID=585013 RepID=A0ABR3EQT1_9AGAR
MSTNVAITQDAPNAASTAVVLAAQATPQSDASVTFQDASVGGIRLSEHVSWSSPDDNTVRVGALQSREDLWMVLKKVFPSGLALEDILRALLNRIIELQGDRPGLLTKLKRQLLNEQSISFKSQQELEDLYRLLGKAMELIQYFERCLKDQGAEIEVLVEHSKSLSEKIKELEQLVEHQKATVENGAIANEALATLAVQATRGNPMLVWPTITDMVRRIKLELGAVGDTLRVMNVPIPPNLGAAAGWVDEMDRFLSQTATASQQIAGEISEASLTRSGVMRFIRKRIPNISWLLAASNSFPREPLPPYPIPSNSAGCCSSCKAAHPPPFGRAPAASCSQKRPNTEQLQLAYPCEKKSRRGESARQRAS